MRTCPCLRIRVLLFPAALAAALFGCSPDGMEAGPSPRSAIDTRHFDGRIEYNADLLMAPNAAQLDAVRAKFAHINVAATFDLETGVTRSLSNPVGFLTAATSTADPLAIAVSFARDHHHALGLALDDLRDVEVTDYVPSRVTGVTHVYLRQMFAGIAVYNGQLQVNVARDGRVISVNNAFVPQLARAANQLWPVLSAADAAAEVARHLGIALDHAPLVTAEAAGVNQATVLRAEALSLRPVPAQLMWLSIRAGEARLVWNLQTETPDGEHWFDMTVDAASGKVWTRTDWVAAAQYRVYPVPVESPTHTSPAPPADARALVTDPANATASPQGWQSTGSTSYVIPRGNNVHAYEDSDNNGAPPSVEPSCGSGLICDFPIDLTSNPVAYRDAAVANLFYWNNIVHDVQYHYGFDEAAGNFQINTFGRGGVGGDDVRAEAQDGGGTNNANFSTSPDGSRPRMQMYLWTRTTPQRDGDLDAGIIVHEYGHGISNRQVGGPSNVSCLRNNQQPGEGWSDWLALAYTAKVGDAGTDVRGIGTYALGQPPTGPGIRTQPYSTDPAVNNHTYESIIGKRIPHGVGEVWAQGLWEVYWALVNKYGFSSTLYAVSQGAGNHRAMLYVNEGMKFTICSPAFTDARDGIIQAATASFGGQDVCLLWQTFAAFGLGVDAVSGGPSSTNPTNGFAVPAECQCSPQPVADAGADQAICPGQSVTIGTPARADTTYSWSPGGQTSARITVAPTATTTYTVTATTSCGTATDSVVVQVGGSTPVILHQTDFESGANGWFHSAADSTCSAGNWVVGDPDGVTNGGVTTQLEDDHTVPRVNALFTAPNTAGAGTDDVDGGVCTARSPVISVAAGTSAQVSLWYYHGQRDAGDDPTGDFFRVDLSTDGGATFATNLVSIGDVTSNAAWTQLQRTVTGPAQVALRVQASDGPGPGDLVEGGIDDVKVTTSLACP